MTRSRPRSVAVRNTSMVAWMASGWISPAPPLIEPATWPSSPSANTRVSGPRQPRRSASPTSQRTCGNAARKCRRQRDPAATGAGALDDLDAAVLRGRSRPPRERRPHRLEVERLLADALGVGLPPAVVRRPRPGTTAEAGSAVWPSSRSVATYASHRKLVPKRRPDRSTDPIGRPSTWPRNGR